MNFIVWRELLLASAKSCVPAEIWTPTGFAQRLNPQDDELCSQQALQSGHPVLIGPWDSSWRQVQDMLQAHI